MSFHFTENQSRAIESRGRTLLVSAAAGSGKTRVLTERVMRYVTDPVESVDIDRFLIITYTRAAAGEMRSRIMDSIASAAAANPSDLRLRRQQDKCWQAQIGTIHSFCTTLLREHCHLIGLPPAFRVMDEDRAAKMKSAALEKLLESRYEHLSAHPGFVLLADSVGAGRDDRRLGDTVLRLYEKIRSHPYPGDWCREQAEHLDSLDTLSDAAETVWGRLVLDEVKETARYWSRRMDEAVLEIHSADEKIIKAYGGAFMDDAAALRDFVRALDEGWDRARQFLPTEFAQLGRLVKYDNLPLKDRVKAVRDNWKKAAEGIAKSLAEPSCAQLEDMRRMAPAIKALLSLCMDFDRAFSAEKRREGLVDFGDLEHMALELLVDKESGKATWIAVELSQRYREIMVDEYQDVNAVQDMIFHAISREGKNLFMVGDVKQSIYRFRLADPTIFLDKYESFADWSEEGKEPRRILLQENFRSRKSVLDCANHVFSNIMSRELGELEYDEDAALRYGAPDYPEGTDIPAELCLIDPLATDSEEETPEKTALEARYVARRIREMMDAGTPVSEGGRLRRCRWSDFALLMRSPSGKGSIFHAELAKAGIPVHSTQAGGFFTALEVSIAIDMLAIIDNPHADVPLISVLRSPAFGFEPDELASIRAADRRGDFYTALLAAAEGGNGRCAAFAEKLAAIRKAAPDMSLDALLWRVYTETGLFSICSAMNGGDERRANLMSLFQLARSFEESGYRGLFRFVAWLRRMAERGQEPQRLSEGDSVSIMSIHKSKGLEFPFVFLCDLAHKFNKNDSRENVLIHSSLGLGPKLTDTARGVEYPTLARRAIERQLETEMLSEEMRVLYVAMTRARERLIMTAALPKAGEKIEKMRVDAESPMPPALLRSAGSFAHWLCCAAALDSKGFISLRIIPADSVEENQSDNEEASEAVCCADAAVLDAMRKNFAHSYPFAEAVELPTKLSATELGRYDGGEEAAGLVRQADDYDFRRPAFSAGDAGKLSAAARGTATHSFMQYVDFSAAGSREGLEAERRRMAESGFLTAAEAEAVSLSAVEKFFQSELGLLLRNAEKVHREFRFTLLCDAADCLGGNAQGEEVLLQGIIDCLVEEPEDLTVIDYKTDRVSPESAPERAGHYRSQIEAYSEAAERIFGKKVRRRVLHFLTPGVSVEM